MTCARRRRLQLSRVLFLFSVVLCSLYQPIISARLDAPLPLTQVGKDLEEDSVGEVEETTGGAQELEDPFTATHTFKSTDQLMTEMHLVHQRNTADYEESNLTLPKVTDAHCTTVAPESFNNTTPASLRGNLHIRGEYPEDLFSVEDRRRGWVILHIIGMIYMFISLVILCDEFFIPALGVFTDKLAIPDDVTGATFMAVGVSLPKFFAILIGVFVSHRNVLFGTVVCSAVFNILFVIGICALFSREVLRLTWRPLFRDVSFYMFCIILVLIFFLDNAIEWWESLILVTCYALYGIYMKFYMQIWQAVKTQPQKHKDNVEVISIEEEEKKCVSEDLDCPEGFANASIGEDGSDRDLKVCVKNDCDDVNKKKKEEEKRDRPLSLDWPDTRLKQATFLFLLPINFPLWLIVPDVRKQKSRKFFVITFLVSILWIAVFSYFMLWWARQVGETFGISHWIMAVVAAETSIPDLITSVIVARKGLGDMAVSSSLGRNIFSITVCLPVPWLLNSAFHGFALVPVNNSGFFCLIGLLLLPLLYVVISIASCKWKINKVLGFTMLLFYMIFQLTRVLFQYRIILCPV